MPIEFSSHGKTTAHKVANLHNMSQTAAQTTLSKLHLNLRGTGDGNIKTGYLYLKNTKSGLEFRRMNGLRKFFETKKQDEQVASALKTLISIATGHDPDAPAMIAFSDYLTKKDGGSKNYVKSEHMYHQLEQVHKHVQFGVEHKDRFDALGQFLQQQQKDFGTFEKEVTQLQHLTKIKNNIEELNDQISRADLNPQSLDAEELEAQVANLRNQMNALVKERKTLQHIEANYADFDIPGDLRMKHSRINFLNDELDQIDIDSQQDNLPEDKKDDLAGRKVDIETEVKTLRQEEKTLAEKWKNSNIKDLYDLSLKFDITNTPDRKEARDLVIQQIQNHLESLSGDQSFIESTLDSDLLVESIVSDESGELPHNRPTDPETGFPEVKIEEVDQLPESLRHREVNESTNSTNDKRH